MEDINKIAITISGIEQSNGKVSLLEQVGDRQYPTRYSFFEQTQEGKPSKAYEQFQELELKVGDVANIAVKEVKKPNQFGKEVTYRNIAYFLEGGVDVLDNPKNSSEVNSEPLRTNYRPTKEAMGKRKEFQNTMDYKAQQISKAQSNKENAIRLASSGRDAVLIVTSFYGEIGIDGGNVSREEQIKEKIEYWRGYLYNKIYNDTPFV